MNRIKLGPLAAEPLVANSFEDPDTELFGPDLLTSDAQTWTGEHSLFVPMHYEPGYAYPLVVWLHGDESDCSELQKFMPEISVRNYIGVAPRSGLASNNSPISWPHCEESIDAAYECVMAAIDEARLRFNVNDSRVFIAGVGTGGTMAFQLAFDRPDVFAGVISVDGPIDTNSSPLRDLERSRELPVLISAFRHSETLSQEELCQYLRLLYVAGFSTTVRQYPGSVELSSKVLSDIDRWLMEQIETSIC